MPAARYWRATGFAAYGGAGLSLSEFRLYAGSTLLDAAATLTASIAPDTGTLSSLFDGAATPSVTWSAGSATSPAFGLVWDLVTPADVLQIRLGSGASMDNFPFELDFQYSSDALDWTTAFEPINIAYPGANALTAVPTGGGAFVPLQASPPVRLVMKLQNPVFLPDENWGQFNVSGVRPLVNITDFEGGNGRIYGTVKEKNTPLNTPLRRRVLLMDERRQVVLQSVWSDSATGNYEFLGVNSKSTYTVISYDHLRNYRAVIADNMMPELMPGVLQ